ncbi:MAG: Clp protease N-terminal domain-containing protein, partial [Saezia sp.]
MPQEKFTSMFTNALASAQRLALGHDNAYIEPIHILAAMLEQQEGPKSLLARAGINTGGLLQAASSEIDRLPSVQGQDQLQFSRDSIRLLQAAEKEAIKWGDQFVASEMFLLSLADSKDNTGELVRKHGLSRVALESAIKAVRGSSTVDNPESEGQREALKKYTID